MSIINPCIFSLPTRKDIIRFVRHKLKRLSLCGLKVLITVTYIQNVKCSGRQMSMIQHLAKRK